jgi:hypothetical protein
VGVLLMQPIDHSALRKSLSSLFRMVTLPVLAKIKRSAKAADKSNGFNLFRRRILFDNETWLKKYEQNNRTSKK